MRFVEPSMEMLRSDAFRQLVSFGLYQADELAFDAFLQELYSHKARIFFALDDIELLGQVTVIEKVDNPVQGNDVVIKSISVRPDYRKKGIGRYMLQNLLSHLHTAVLVAETDDEAVGFYHQCGFRIRSLGEVYPGTIRYHCRYDHATWASLSYRDAIDRLQKHGVQAWVAGGWALDLFHGRQTREHVDTDIVICRPDQGVLFTAFPEWEIYKTHAPGLARWPGNDYLDTTPNVWLRRNQDSPWSVEVMFLDIEGEEWVYRRNTAIRGRIEDLGLVTTDGIPYLRPEIQLLYKGGSSILREKDTGDFLNILPILSEAMRSWLVGALRIQFPQGHEWLRYLDELQTKEANEKRRKSQLPM